MPERRDKVVTVRFKPREWALVEAAAELADVEPSAYVRAAALARAVRKPRVKAEGLAAQVARKHLEATS